MPKNKGNCCLFQCFKHNDVVTPHRKAKTPDSVLSYINLAEKHGIAFPTIFSSAFRVANGDAEERSASHQIGKYRCSRLRQALMAALNHTSLGKKILNKRNTKKDTLSRSRIRKLKGQDDKISNAFTICSSSSSTCSSGSSFELYLWPSTMNGNIEVTKQKQDVGGNMAVCLHLLTSLLVLILWGKFCAILCTSIGFFLVPHSRRKY